MIFYSPKRVAEAIGASEASLKRWCDRGVLRFSRTAGGHRRIAREDVLFFLRETGQAVISPEILDLPGKREEGWPGLSTALIEGKAAQVRAELMQAWLGGTPVVQLCDEMLAPAFENIGSSWEHGQAEVYMERRACEIIQNLLYELLRSQIKPQADAPLALGGSLNGDPYTLANLMVQVTMQEMGWRASSLGAGLNGETLVRAIENEKPRLFWLSVSSVSDEAQFSRDTTALWEACQRNACLLAVGGRALDAMRRRGLLYHCHCDRLVDLVNFVRATLPQTEK